MSRTTSVISILLLLVGGFAQAQEMRAMWVDAFHAGLRNGTETSAVINAARAANCNAVFVQVRKRGDAYYRNGLEPVATDVAAGFDPLGDLIQKARTGSPRIQVHAWLVTYNIWNHQTNLPTQLNHPYRVYPQWLTENNSGVKWGGTSSSSGNYQFDQGHPEVQQYTFNVTMDILTRYDVDGIHFDYIRYADYNSSGNNQPWGYNPVTVGRFNKLKNRTGVPAPTDPVWLQWRRDQVTALLRKVYLNAWDKKPNVAISAALITYGTAPSGDSTWPNSEAYSRVLQDWRGWLQEGILDLGCPMVYRGPTSNGSLSGWTTFIRDRQYSRSSAIGLGWYLNPVSNTITQIDIARTTSSTGNKAVGVLGYSYAVPNNEGISQSNTWTQLKSGPFATVVTPPPMPWKTSTTRGHLMGFALPAGEDGVFDGATVTLTGPVSRTLISDATGFFGAVDLPVGTYTVSISEPGYRSVTRQVTVTAATVARPATVLERVPLQITSLARSAASNTLSITWNSIPGRSYSVQASSNVQSWSTVASAIVAAGTTTSYQWPIPTAWRSQAFLRVREEP